MSLRKGHQVRQFCFFIAIQIDVVFSFRNMLVLFTSFGIFPSTGGSLFLFNRRVLRFFRKDGYVWRKKRDGRTISEAHERLKVVPSISYTFFLATFSRSVSSDVFCLHNKDNCKIKPWPNVYWMGPTNFSVATGFSSALLRILYV